MWQSAFSILSFDIHKSPVVRVGSPPPVHKPLFPEMDRNRSNQVSVLTDPCSDNGGRNRQACHYRAMLELFFHQCGLKMERTVAKLMASQKKTGLGKTNRKRLTVHPLQLLRDFWLVAVQLLLACSLHLRSEMQAKKVGSKITLLLGTTGSLVKDFVDLRLDSRGLPRGCQKYRKTLHFLDLAEQILVKPLRFCTFL